MGGVIRERSPTGQDRLDWQGLGMEQEGEEEEVRVYKILVLGNSGAGKTSLVRRSVREYFSRDYRY